MTLTRPGAHLVRPLDPVVRDALASAVHLLRHDLSNALVAAMGGLELEALDAPDPALAERLLAVRASLHRPFDALRRVAQGLPLPQGHPGPWPQRWSALVVRAQAQGVGLLWSPDDPLHWHPAPWQTVVLEILVTNALDALEGRTGVLSQVSVTVQDGQLEVADNGPGCVDVEGAATGRLRRAGSGHLGHGLAVAASLVAEAGGTLTVASPAGGGWIATAAWPT